MPPLWVAMQAELHTALGAQGRGFEVSRLRVWGINLELRVYRASGASLVRGGLGVGERGGAW